MTDQDDDANHEAARRVFDQIREARKRAREVDEIMDIQNRVTDTVADTSQSAVKRLAGAVQDEGKAAGAELHQIVRSAARSLREAGALVRANRYRFN